MTTLYLEIENSYMNRKDELVRYAVEKYCDTFALDGLCISDAIACWFSYPVPREPGYRLFTIEIDLDNATTVNEVV